jgi:hypothetical protein
MSQVIGLALSSARKLEISLTASSFPRASAGWSFPANGAFVEVESPGDRSFLSNDGG